MNPSQSVNFARETTGLGVERIARPHLAVEVHGPFGIVEFILDGGQPIALTAQKLKRTGDLPLFWDDQRSLVS